MHFGCMGYLLASLSQSLLDSLMCILDAWAFFIGQNIVIILSLLLSFVRQFGIDYTRVSIALTVTLNCVNLNCVI